MSKFKVGLISVGSHCQTNIIPSLIEMNDVEIVGFYTRNSDTISQIREKYNINYYESVDDMLALPSINFVYISSPNSLHHSFIMKSLERDKSIIVEKTAVGDLIEAKEVVALANSKNLLVYEAFMYKHHQQFARLKNILDSKIYGEVKKVFINFGFPHLKSGDIRYSQELNGGALYDAGAYTVSAMNALFGDTQLVCSNMEKAGHNVDVTGYAVFSACDNVICFLNWGFGLSYKNEIHIWTDKEIITVDRAFAKPKTLKAAIFHDANGQRYLDSEVSCNHFTNMFDFVFNLDTSKYKTVNNELINQMLTLDVIMKGSKS